MFSSGHLRNERSFFHVGELQIFYHFLNFCVQVTCSCWQSRMKYDAIEKQRSYRISENSCQWSRPGMISWCRGSSSNIKAPCLSQRTCPRLDRVAVQLDLDEVWNGSTCRANYPQPVAGCLWRLCFGWMLVGLPRTGSTGLIDTLLLVSYFQ